MSDIEHWPVRDVIVHVETGDGWNWGEEATRLRIVHGDELLALTADIEANGVRTPIEVARTVDGRLRMWDGHHRVIIAAELGLETIPVHMSQENE